ncbi:MAG TPA: DNA-directed RNA polymerase subunit L [Candidatus Acidoferrum sp.]|nr:DNA-directed RNA polymerase subunit L [Candidatus Acidoferrum sp.]
MNIKIIKLTQEEAEIEFTDEGHTFLNALKSLLLQDPRVKVATYDIKHPMISNPIFYINTEKIDPLVPLREASARLSETCVELLELIKLKLEEPLPK